MKKFLKTLPHNLGLLAFCLTCQLYSDNKGVMEETGNTTPSNYTFFQGHLDSIKIARRYLPRNPVIIDAGAFDGKESCLMARFWPLGQIHSFEPVTELYERVLNNIKPFPNVHAYQMALGTEVGEQIMYLSTEPYDLNHVSMSSSLSPPKEHLLYSGTIFRGTQNVKVTTIDEWAEENNITKVDMLWLDMQGGELAAMKASPNILKTVSVIVSEVEFVEAYKGQPLYHEVRSWLEDQGFVLVAGNFKFPKDPGQWFGDGIFVRKTVLEKRK